MIALAAVMRFPLIGLLGLLLVPVVRAQVEPSVDARIMRVTELLKRLPDAATDVERDTLSAGIQRELGAILRREDAFALNLEGLPMSRIDAPDGAFRLLTWNVPRTDGTHHYEGWLLARTGKRIELHALRDASAAIPSPEVPELGPDRWYGALYYQCVPVKKGAKTWYTLLGWKGHSNVETRKVIEVLHFRSATPRFGAPLFGTGKLKAQRRVFGYSFQTSMLLRYEEATGRIVMDHLSPARPDLAGQWAFYGPDLSYDAYVWDKDHWRFERDVDARDPRRDKKPFNAPPPSPRP
jgi:hypothetical protein